ncbi:MAG: electron transport complex subunit RsxC, partial [Thermodesulfobacteriota bacterium]
MAFMFKGFSKGGTFPRGVHPPERKAFSEEAAIEVMPSPARVTIPLLQHVGAPCKPVVKAKAMVAFGDRIAEAGGFVSAGLHAPIAGKVMKTGVTTLANGRHVSAIPIKAEGEQLEGSALWDEIFGGEWPKAVDGYAPEEIVAAIQEAGV